MCKVSLMSGALGDTQKIIEIRQDSVRLSRSTHVRGVSLYGMKGFFSARALITFPRWRRLSLIPTPSAARFADAFATASEPARSTRLSFLSMPDFVK